MIRKFDLLSSPLVVFGFSMLLEYVFHWVLSVFCMPSLVVSFPVRGLNPLTGIGLDFNFSSLFLCFSPLSCGFGFSCVVRESKNEAGRGGGRGGGRGYGRGRGGGFNGDRINNENPFSNNGVSGGYSAPEGGATGKPSERRGYGASRGAYRGGRRGGFNNGEGGDGERPRRVFERHSGSGHGLVYSFYLFGYSSSLL